MKLDLKVVGIGIFAVILPGLILGAAEAHLPRTVSRDAAVLLRQGFSVLHYVFLFIAYLVVVRLAPRWKALHAVVVFLITSVIGFGGYAYLIALVRPSGTTARLIMSWHTAIEMAMLAAAVGLDRILRQRHVLRGVAGQSG